MVATPPTLLCSVTFPANTGFAWDAIERSYARMADALAPRGVRTLVAYPAITEFPRTLSGSSAVPVTLDTTMKTRRARAAMRAFIERENVRIVYLTDAPLWSPWYRSLRRRRARLIVVHDHTSGLRSAPRGVRQVVKRVVTNLPGFPADVIVGVSDFVVERDRAASLISPDRFRTIWNGVESPSEPVRSPDVRTLLNVTPDTPVVACACRATREKGVDVLFRAFERIDAVGGRQPVLAYIGDGPQMTELRNLRDSLGSRERISLLGYMPGASDVLRSANVCVVPSVWQEAFGLSVLEMMARGRAVIASRTGGIPEIIIDNESGILVDPYDVSGLAHAIASVLRSPDLQRSLGHAARVRASTLFTLDQQVAQMIDTFAAELSR